MIQTGKFTSPHMISYNDCISINNRTYPMSKFQKVMNEVMGIDKELGLRCTEFEILTVAAYKIFEIEKVDIALIEVGVGGRLDATNVLMPYDGSSSGGVIACGITKIGMDHESLLGSTLSQIAREKAGIMKTGIPCFVDGSNEQEVLNTIRTVGNEVGSNVTIINPTAQAKELIQYSPLKGSYQLHNLSLALSILNSIQQSKHLPTIISKENIIHGIRETKWPGRLQTVHHPTLADILIDGAHNESAAIELKKFLNETYPDNKNIIFVIAITKGKSVEKLLKQIASRQDTVITTSFSQPDNMPWIKSESTKKVADVARGICEDVVEVEDGVVEALEYVQKEYRNKRGDSRPVVVCGSLYLCADVLRAFSEKHD
ncbi:FOL3 [[Candida] subhashii]|uniref:FOL3 n=1 Tax=[Candida] subhashii TaxID=561895 RepID=A0A8J5QNA4_9ASCO|nr:FOL3 [[Candida] subhashii]KAG7664993.1 FOL3 [[Candida] subhashii]